VASLLFFANDARASPGCTAVNSGVFNLADAPGGGFATASQAGFAAGDELKITYKALSAGDTFVLSPTSGGPALDNFHPTVVTTVRTHTLTASQLSLTLSVTNGFPFGGTATASTTATCTPVAVLAVTAIAPASGSTAGGPAVTITGALLTGATAVTIGGAAATAVTVVNATTITATTLAHAAGAVDVAVTTPDGTATGAGLYTYVAPPTVTAINPVTGPPAGGTAVTITGTNLTGATSVSIGGAAATGVTVVNATTITATTPAHAAGSANVSVTTAVGTGIGTSLFTYAAPPTVTAIDPDLGPPAGGALVTITGTNLTGATSVTLGGAAATGVTVVNATTITVRTPAHAAGLVSVAVTTPGGTGSQAGLYTYAAVPTVTAVSPGGGPIAGGTAITLTGTDLDGATAVTIDGVAATSISVVNATTITARTPAHAAGRVSVAVTTPGGSATGAGLYVYRANLTLTSSPSAVTQVGEPYSQTNVASGGTPDYRYSLTAGSLPAGTSLNASTGLVSGTPTASGAFSYTIEVQDDGAVPPRATQDVSGSITPIGTTTSLVSSLSPSLVGEPVTLTATVAPASATGSVTFRTGAAILCSAAPLANAVATCATTFAVAGDYSVVADYDGNTALGASVSPTLLQAVNDQRVRAVQVIGTFINRRNDLITANEPDASGQIDRLIEIGNSGAPAAPAGSAAQPAGSAHAASGVLSRLRQNVDVGEFTRLTLGTREPGLATLHDNRFMGASALNIGEMALRLVSAVTGPLRVSGNGDGAMRFAVATSLRQMRNADAAQIAGRGTTPPKSSPFDIWIDGKYASFHDARAGSDLDGHFRLVSIGGDYVVTRTLLVGGMVQFDGMRQRSNEQTSIVNGHGWMAGPYATVRLADKVFWQGRAAWGRSTNDASPFQTYTEQFGSARWLVSSSLAGRLELQRWVFRPAVSVAYLEDAAGSFTDTFGVAIPGIQSRIGQAKVGPQIDYRYPISRRIALESRAGLQMLSTFGGTRVSEGPGPIEGANAGPSGSRGRGELGVNMITVSGFGIDVSGSYDGIGATDYSGLAGRVVVRVPLGP
jgi:hypothetical protein